MTTSKRELSIKAAILFYEKDLSREMIAKKLDISRSYVSQLLNYARDTGIVKTIITVDEYELRMLKKEIDFALRFPKTTFYIMKSNSTDFTQNQIGRFASPYITQLINEADVIGVGLGTSIMNAISALEDQDFIDSEDKTVVQMMGGLNNRIEAGSHPNELVRKLSSWLRCDYYYLNCPALVEGPEIRKALLKEDSISTCINMWNHIDLALMGIGAPNRNSTLFSGFPTRFSEAVEKSAAKGELNINLFDAEGKAVPLLEEHKICVSGPTLKRIRKKVVVGYGKHKVESIISVLRAGYIDVLITDSLTADLIEERLSKDEVC